MRLEVHEPLRVTSDVDMLARTRVPRRRNESIRKRIGVTELVLLCTRYPGER